MISITCTNCQTGLSIDDAFAGGVCRCRHCGTIQTVPSHLKGGATPKPSKVNSPQQAGRELYRKGTGGKSLDPGGTGSGTGLDELAEVVASSGMIGSGSGLTSSRLRKSSEQSGRASGPPPRSLAPWLAVAGIVIVVLLGALLWLAMGRAKPQAAEAIETIPQTTAAPAPGPSFCGIKLDAPVVIYVLDRGNGTRDLFDTLKEATYKSIESLGPDRKFQVIFWNNGQQDDAYPAGLPAYATPQNLSACRRAMEDISAFGQTDAQSALKKAFANRAEIIVIATGKALELDQSFADQVMSARKSNSAKIDTVALGDANSTVLRDLSNRTGGEYRTVSASKLRSFSE